MSTWVQHLQIAKVGPAFTSEVFGCGVVQVWVNQKVSPINLIIRQSAYLKFMLWYFFTYDNQKRLQHITQTYNKHHHHGGGAACPSSGMDLMKSCQPRGGWPCEYIFRGRCQRILLDSINKMRN
jgi:hypothetical protein